MIGRVLSLSVAGMTAESSRCRAADRYQGAARFATARSKRASSAGDVLMLWRGCGDGAARSDGEPRRIRAPPTAKCCAALGRSAAAFLSHGAVLDVHRIGSRRSSRQVHDRIAEGSSKSSPAELALIRAMDDGVRGDQSEWPGRGGYAVRFP